MDDFQAISSVNAEAFTIQFGSIASDGSCEIVIEQNEQEILRGSLSGVERQRFLGSIRGDYSVWRTGYDAFQAALRAYTETQDVDTWGDGRDGFRRSMAAAIAAYLMVAEMQPKDAPVAPEHGGC